MAENLKNTVLIDNTEYNINAVEADTAKQLKNSLVIQKPDGSELNFNGKTESTLTLDYISKTGGTFEGDIYINSKSDANKVLTNSEVLSKMAELDGSSIYFWNDNQLQSLEKILDGNKSTLHELTTIIGTYDSFEALKEYIENLDTGTMLSFEEDNTGYIVAGFKNTGTDKTTIISIPDTFENKPVRQIKDEAFKETSARVKKIIIPYGVTSLGVRAFYNYTALEEIILPSSLTSISLSAFEECTNLRKIVIPKSIKSINDGAFYGCSNNLEIIYTGSAEDWGKIDIVNNGGSNNALSTAEISYTNKDTLIGNPIGSPIKCSSITESPFIFICLDSAEAANRMFLKLPEKPFIEISKGATHLSSTTTNKSYTYEYIANVFKTIETFDSNTINEIKVKIAAIEAELKYVVEEGSPTFAAESRIDKLEDMLDKNKSAIAEGYADIIEFEWD